MYRLNGTRKCQRSKCYKGKKERKTVKSDTLYTPPDLSSVHQTFAFRIKESPFQPINAVEENLSQISSEGDSDNALASESTKQGDDDLATSGEIELWYF